MRKPLQFAATLFGPVLRVAFLLLLSLALSGGLRSAPACQQTVQDPRLSQRMGDADYDDPLDFLDVIEKERRLRRLNEDRQRHIVADSQRLLQLTTDFNAEVARTSPDRLTPSQLRRLGEIEKLARNIKDRMSIPVGEGPYFRPPGLYIPNFR